MIANFEITEESSSLIVQAYRKARKLKEKSKDDSESYADLTVIEITLEKIVNAILNNALDIEEEAKILRESIVSDLGMMLGEKNDS